MNELGICRVSEQHGLLSEVPDPSRLPEQANWEAYIAEEVQELPHGHLVPYPIAVEPEGFVTTLPGHRNFPDTKGSILGATMKVTCHPQPGHTVMLSVATVVARCK